MFEHSLSYDLKQKLFEFSTLGDKDEKTGDIHGCRVFLDSTLSRQMFLGLPFSTQWVSLHRLGEKSLGKVNLLFDNQSFFWFQVRHQFGDYLTVKLNGQVNLSHVVGRKTQQDATSSLSYGLKFTFHL
jgi:hypothetical protein